MDRFYNEISDIFRRLFWVERFAMFLLLVSREDDHMDRYLAFVVFSLSNIAYLVYSFIKRVLEFYFKMKKKISPSCNVSSTEAVDVMFFVERIAMLVLLYFGAETRWCWFVFLGSLAFSNLVYLTCFVWEVVTKLKQKLPNRFSLNLSQTKKGSDSGMDVQLKKQSTKIEKLEKERVDQLAPDTLNNVSATPEETYQVADHICYEELDKEKANDTTNPGENVLVLREVVEHKSTTDDWNEVPRINEMSNATPNCCDEESNAFDKKIHLIDSHSDTDHDLSWEKVEEEDNDATHYQDVPLEQGSLNCNIDVEKVVQEGNHDQDKAFVFLNENLQLKNHHNRNSSCSREKLDEESEKNLKNGNFISNGSVSGDQLKVNNVVHEDSHDKKAKAKDDNENVIQGQEVAGNQDLKGRKHFCDDNMKKEGEKYEKVKKNMKKMKKELKKERDDRRKWEEEKNNLVSKLCAAMASCEVYKGLLNDREEDRRKWEEEKNTLAAKLCAATASSEVYRGLLHDLGC